MRRFFLHLVGKLIERSHENRCFDWVSAHVGRDPRGQEKYLEAGVGLKNLYQVPDDHIEIELEFLYYLIREAIESMKTGKVKEAKARIHLISRGEMPRGAHEAVVSEDPGGQHNPLASQGPLDGTVHPAIPVDAGLQGRRNGGP